MEGSNFDGWSFRLGFDGSLCARIRPRGSVDRLVTRAHRISSVEGREGRFTTIDSITLDSSGRPFDSAFGGLLRSVRRPDTLKDGEKGGLAINELCRKS